MIVLAKKKKKEFSSNQKWIRISYLENALTMPLCPGSGLCRCDMAESERQNKNIVIIEIILL